MRTRSVLTTLGLLLISLCTMGAEGCDGWLRSGLIVDSASTAAGGASAPIVLGGPTGVVTPTGATGATGATGVVPTSTRPFPAPTSSGIAPVPTSTNPFPPTPSAATTRDTERDADVSAETLRPSARSMPNCEGKCEEPKPKPRREQRRERDREQDRDRDSGRGPAHERGHEFDRARDSEADVAGAATDPEIDRVLRLTNRYRVKHGLQPLEFNERLAEEAGFYARRMQKEKFFDHTTPDGTTFDERAHRFGTGWRHLGENLAMGYPSADEAVTAWIDSPGHRANLLNESFSEIGIAVEGRDHRYWVQEFGARSGN